MRVLDRLPAAPGASGGFAVRRDWEGGHEFVSFRFSADDALTFALVDQRQWAGGDVCVSHAVVPITVLAYELHAGRLCQSAQCPRGTAVSGDSWARAGGSQ